MQSSERFPDPFPPPFASGWGDDTHGLWVDLEMPRASETGPVVQRLRWIENGTFLRGSPDDEAGRRDNEGPQREVRIARGFWLFDTPCTQALWEAVMGENPSYFKSPDRPVEQVIWAHVQGFLARINKHIPGLGLVLPNEAQWEYACRAGTRTATYAGDLQILGENNAPALDPIAWYGGNSGEDFELDNGWDSSGWKDKQYPHQRAGTWPVGLKAPNAWGLYDMLGNVFEWCADQWHDSYNGAPTDGRAWRDVADPDASHVLRGGSWYYPARDVRSAARRARGPGDRRGSLGFRCARVQS